MGLRSDFFFFFFLFCCCLQTLLRHATDRKILQAFVPKAVGDWRPNSLTAMLRGGSLTPLLVRPPEWDMTSVSHLTFRNVTTVNVIMTDVNDADQSPMLSRCSYCSYCSVLRLLSSTGSSSVLGRRCRSCRRERTLRCLWNAMTSPWRSLAGEHLDPSSLSVLSTWPLPSSLPGSSCGPCL